MSDRVAFPVPDVYVMEASGAGQTRLTSEGYNLSPVWSPSGDRIAWIRDRQSDIGLHVMNPDGTGQRNLTPGLGAWGPTWSPDGSALAFSAHAETNGSWSDQIFSVGLTGTAPVRLTTTSSGGYGASWSPDGTRIAFLGSPTIGSNRDVYVMNADGSNPVNLTNTAPAQGNDDPSWSPDGGRIAFTSWRDGNSEIYSVDADGSNLVNLTRTLDRAESGAVWSPRGDRIAYQCVYQEIWLMLPDGTGQRMLTRGITFAWSPDGRRIVFCSDRSDRADVGTDIYSIAEDGSEPMRLTRHPASDCYPQWTDP
ncbi:MAG TPA: hypothetical protein VFT32_01430 [Candidatus Eisenbacteria bacterium]|nr:hypothetical protein [Candidatus Eisenbacteria bacterium]